jgi:hypothetical protein
MCEPSENQAVQPTEEKLKEAIEHIKTAVPDGCVCGLCETVRSLINAQTSGDKSLYASASVIRRLDLLVRMR